ncbi:MAG TPA: ATP-grasp domain-containing protein [Bryobacteraceae bacterium]|jgi:D-alanine-D-alanine ligase|nr:ATP-grasp domain-containing protein [Bryobacteraceae bacterium]
MKVLLLFDVARPVAPDVAYTAEMFVEEYKTAESNVLESLQRLGHEVQTMAVFDSVGHVFDKVRSFAPDIVFNQCESFHDDRALEPNIPALLEMMKIRYTGSGPDGLLLCKDKALAKEILSHHHVRVPRFIVSHLKSPLRRLQHFGYPAFVKPIGQESSDGIAKASFVRDEKEAIDRLRFLHQKFNSDAMIEEYIDGREIYVSVLGNRRRAVFPPREIFFENVPDDEPKFATSHAKWNDAYRKKWGITNGPAVELPPEVKKDLNKIARNVYAWLRIRGFGRIDIRVSSRNELFIIEANPNPSLAAEDDFAQSANAEGFTYDAMIQEILNAAL